MTEQAETIGLLQALGVLDSIRWAYTSALTRTLADYSEDAGHDATLLGTMRHTLFRDRLDRVFSCGRYQLGADADPSSGLEVLHAELTDRDKATMPRLAVGLVQAAPLNGSPGWRFGERRFLMTSCDFGKIDSLPWSEKSETKQRVAKQQNWDHHPSLFDGTDLENVDWLFPIVDEPLDLDTFVVAHTLDVVRQRSQLVFGRPLLNIGGGEAWRWYETLDHTPPTPGGHRIDQPQAPSPDVNVADAPVRLRKSAGQQGNQAGAE